MFPGLVGGKSLELSRSALLLLVNHFNSFNFAFSIATIFLVLIVHNKLRIFCSNMCICIGKSNKIHEMRFYQAGFIYYS